MFFEPQNRIDVLAIAKSLDKCILQAESLIMSHEYVKAIEIAVCILEEIGCRMFHDGKQMRVDRIKDVINAMCNNTIRILSTIETLPGISAEIKERIDTERQSLFIRFPFCHFQLSKMIIAVDFDGTIVEHKYPHIGKEIPFAISTLKRLQAEHHQLILWTVREGRLLEEAVNFVMNVVWSFMQ